MSIAENKAFIGRYLDALSGKEKPESVINQFVSDQDEELRQHIAYSEVAFPRYELVIQDMVAEGDKVAVRATLRATHQGVLMGIPPTGKHIEVPAIIIYRVDGGKIVQHWMNVDNLGLLQQLGVIPVAV
jgi:predicted ester cyclase